MTLSPNQVAILDIARARGVVWLAEAHAFYSSSENGARALKELVAIGALRLHPQRWGCFVYIPEVAEKLVIYQKVDTKIAQEKPNR